MSLSSNPSPAQETFLLHSRFWDQNKRANRPPPLRCWAGPSAISLCFQKRSRGVGTSKIEEWTGLERPEKVSKLAERDHLALVPWEKGRGRYI
jgi:hypothetical protein